MLHKAVLVVWPELCACVSTLITQTASAVNALSVHQADIQLLNYTGEKLENPEAPSVTAKGPSGLGKGLPTPGSKGSLQSGQKEVKGLCTELAALLHDNEDCRVCLRECTGLSTLCSLLLKVRFLQPQLQLCCFYTAKSFCGAQIGWWSCYDLRPIDVNNLYKRGLCLVSYPLSLSCSQHVVS